MEEIKKEIEFKTMTQEEFSKFIESLPSRNIDYDLKESVLERNILELSIAEDRLKMEKINCLKGLLQSYNVSNEEVPQFSENPIRLSRIFTEEDEYPIKNKIFELIKQL
jgi:hypothetical protein